MPLPTRPPECGMIRSPLFTMAATTATVFSFVPRRKHNRGTKHEKNAPRQCQGFSLREAFVASPANQLHFITRCLPPPVGARARYQERAIILVYGLHGSGRGALACRSTVASASARKWVHRTKMGMKNARLVPFILLS